MNTPYYISGREKTNPPSRVSSSRYQFLALKDAEPNLGVPLTNALPASATFLLTTNLAGDRTWLTSLLYDSTYTTFRGTSGNFVSVFNTVQGNSGRWTSAYTTLNANSGTWLTVTSANSLYFKVSGGEIDGNVRVNGDMIVIGVLSALGGIDVIDTKVIETSSLRLVNIGAGPALYVEQAGLANIAEFYDTEGGAALIVGNIAPVGLHNGVIGVCTTTPNETLTVKGTFSASGDVYTFGRIISAGVLLDEIILNAIPATLQSVYATVSANSGSWTSVYNSWNTTSANYTTKQFLSTNFISLCSIDVLGNVNIFGNLVATGSAFFTNTIISTTSALSVINTEQGPALFVSQGKGSGNIAEFYDSDYGDVVLTVGNAVDLNGNVRSGVIGIKTSNPDKTLTVQGEISASGYINSLQLTYVNTNVLLGRDLNTINIGGIQNTIVGEQAAQTIDLGVNNTIIGYQASKYLTDGIENVIIGSGAGQSVSLGNRNTIIGTRAAQQLASGNSNIVIGQQAAPQLLGTNNIVIGQDAGSNITNGNFNILIGTNASATMNTSRAVVIGNNAYATEEFQFVAGSEEFPFINGRFFGDLSYYGKLSGTNLGTESFSARREAFFGGVSRFNNVEVSGYLTVGGQTSAANTLLFGDVTITKALSVPALSAEFITAYKPITAFGGVVGMKYQYNSQTFNSNGAQTNFSLISAVYSVNEILVFVSGVYQNKAAYFLTDNLTLTMTEPVPAGTGILEVVYLNYNPLPIQQTYITVDDGSLGAVKLASNSVITSKIADSNVTPAKLSTGGPSWTTTSDFIVTGNLSAHNISPRANNTFDLGSSNLRWRNIFTQDLHLNNSIGDYTIVEGEDNLYIINNKKKKTYKFALIEVDPAEVPKVSEKD